MARSAESIEGFLALALVPLPAPEADDRPVADRVRGLLESYRDAEAEALAGRAKVYAAHEICREILTLVANDRESHRALMNLLREADEEGASDILEFLVWNPWVTGLGDQMIREKIHDAARTMITDDPSVVRRQAAIRVLYRYGRGGGRDAFLFGLERLDAEPSLEVRDVLLEEMSVAGHSLGLTQEEAAPFVDRLRARLDDGEAWCAVSLAWWSTDEDDFRRIGEKIATDRRSESRQCYVNALDGSMALVRDRTARARALLIGMMNDPTESDSARGFARDTLAETYGPVDPESAEAIRRFDAWREGR